MGRVNWEIWVDEREREEEIERESEKRIGRRGRVFFNFFKVNP